MPEKISATKEYLAVAKGRPLPTADASQNPSLPSWVPVPPDTNVKNVSVAENAEKGTVAGKFYIQYGEEAEWDRITDFYETTLKARGWYVSLFGNRGLNASNKSEARKIATSRIGQKSGRLEVTFEGKLATERNAVPPARVHAKVPAWVPVPPATEPANISVAGNAEKGTVAGKFYIQYDEEAEWDRITDFYETTLKARGWYVSLFGNRGLNASSKSEARKIATSRIGQKSGRLEVTFEGKQTD